MNELLILLRLLTINCIFWVVHPPLLVLPILSKKNFFILMSLVHLILKNYRGMIYQALILFRHIMVLRLLKVVQIMILYSYTGEIRVIIQWHWFIHIFHKVTRGAPQ